MAISVPGPLNVKIWTNVVLKTMGVTKTLIAKTDLVLFFAIVMEDIQAMALLVSTLMNASKDSIIVKKACRASTP